MYTQCPDCQTVFSLDVPLLAQARGYVGCSHCGNEFDALTTLAEQLPPEPFRVLPAQPALSRPPMLELAVYRPRVEPEVVLVAGTPMVDPLPDDDFSELVFTPRFARSKPGPSPRRSSRRKARRQLQRERQWPWLVACLLLTLLLGGQLAWAERDAIIRDPEFGGWLQNTCASLGCRLPLIAAPQRIRLVGSNVQAHPSVPGALMISASILNDATFAQPFPVLRISLSDALGNPVAMRRLQPREYLDDSTTLRSGLAPGASIGLLIEVQDPGNKAVAFDFAFE